MSKLARIAAFLRRSKSGKLTNVAAHIRKTVEKGDVRQRIKNILVKNPKAANAFMKERATKEGIDLSYLSDTNISPDDFLSIEAAANSKKLVKYDMKNTELEIGRAEDVNNILSEWEDTAKALDPSGKDQMLKNINQLSSSLALIDDEGLRVLRAKGKGGKKGQILAVAHVDENPLNADGTPANRLALNFLVTDPDNHVFKQHVGAGSNMMERLIYESRSLGYRGRMELYAMDGAGGFYKNKFGFVDKPRAMKQGEMVLNSTDAWQKMRERGYANFTSPIGEIIIEMMCCRGLMCKPKR